MPKLLVGVLVLIVVMVAVNAVLTQAQAPPKLTVLPGGGGTTPYNPVQGRSSGTQAVQ